MPRRLPQTYRCQPMDDLARQLHFAPPDKRLEQVYRTERLHDQIDPKANYPFDFIVYRITGYHSESEGATLLTGEALLPDLRLLIDMLSYSVDTPHEPGALNPAQLAGKLNISTKTLARWRKGGLRWRWALPKGGGRKELVIPAAALDHFQAAAGDRVDRASQFSQIEPADRLKLINRARRIAGRRPEMSLNQVATHLARRTGRALETLRQLLEQHDRRHPDAAIFIDHRGPLSPRDQRFIARAYRMGVSVERIAARFKRSHSTIYRSIHQRRASHLRRMRIDFVASPMFDREDADEVIVQSDLSQLDRSDRPSHAPQSIDELPAALRPHYAAAALPAQQQRVLFRRYNYLKYKAARLCSELDRYEPRTGHLDAIESLLAQARAIGNTLAAANLPLVLSVARQHLVGKPDGAGRHLLELLEVGNRVLFKSIKTHDLARNELFAKYLTFQLMRRFVTYSENRPKLDRAEIADDGEQFVKRMLAAAREHGFELEQKPPSH